MFDTEPFVWHEVVTPDQKLSGDFFAGLFGWSKREVNAGPFGTYTIFHSGGRDIAGMMNPTPDTPVPGPFWHTYIAVENADESAEKAIALGGKVVVAPHDVPGVGRICSVSDPTGAIAHLMQPVKAPEKK